MIQTTKAIVINTIKYGDTSLIATCYTEKYGVKTYMLKGILTSKKSTIKLAYFQPLMVLNLTANHNNKGALNFIKDVEVLNFNHSIYSTIKKQTIALFLAEIVYYSIREEEENSQLFQYLETSFLWLETHDNCSNFHLLFLLNLTKFLGFYPEMKAVNTSYFDVLHEFDFSAANRQAILSILIQYFELHLSGFKKPKSLTVLKAVFS